MSKIFSRSFINNTSNSSWTPIAKIREISNKQTNIHVLRIYSYRAEKGQPFQNDLIIRQDYLTLVFKIDNRLDSNNIYAEIKIVKEENGDRTIYVKCSPNSYIYTKLEFTTAESFISPINFGVPNIPDEFFDSLVLEEIKKLDTKERNTNQCHIQSTAKSPATYKVMSIKFNSIRDEGITFALKVQDKEFNSDRSILSADVYCKIWCRTDDETGNPFRATCEMLNSTKSAYDNIKFSIIVDKINLCADLYVTVSRPWLSLLITLIHWNYNTSYLNGYKLYDKPNTEELPGETDDIILTKCEKYSVGNRFIINKNPETTEKNDIIGMINEVNSNLNNFIDTTIDDTNVSNKTTYSSEKIEEKFEVTRNSYLLKETLPNDCVAFWDFAGNKPLVDKLYGHELKVKRGTISYVNKAPFGGGIVLDGTQYLQIDADKVGNLDLSQFGEEVTVLAWVNGEHKENGFIAGMWQEDDNSPKRQYGMFTSLPTYGGYRRAIGHISCTGGASPNIPFSRDYSASGRYVPYKKMCMIGFTYDGNEIISYIDGTQDTYIDYTEPGPPKGEGKTYSKNPYVFKDGLNKTTKANFTVGAVKLTNSMGNFYKGEILGIMIFKRALSKEEICDMNYRYCNDKVILNYYNEKEEKDTSVCWKYGTNIYNTAENKVYKNISLNEVATEYAGHSGFAFTKIGNCYNLYISPSGDGASKHADLSIAMIEGCFPRISQLDRFTFKQNNKGIADYGCRIAIKVDGSIFVSEERFTSAGGNTSGSDWSAAEDKEYVFNVHNKWFKVENGVINKSETLEVPNNRLEGIGFACDEIPNTFDGSNILRVGYATLYRK